MAAIAYFSDSEAAARYAEGPVRQVPGFRDLQRMAALLLAERLDATAQLLVLGAGGGLELKAFAEMQSAWHFDGVDPSAEMLDLARYIIDTRMGRFDISAFDDRYEAALADLVQAKAEGRPLPRLPERETGRVVDLMAALR